MRLLSFVLAVLLTTPACVGSTPEERAARVFCPEVGHGSTEHCPGAPCTGCHGTQFAVAGTIYGTPTDTVGLAGAVVTLRDSDDVVFTAVTNRAGNFIVEATSDPSRVGAGEDGRLFVATAPHFPIVSITVQEDANLTPPSTMLAMASPVHREGSCAMCHMPSDTVTSATGPGRVYAIPPAP